tara:strand:+ start:1915 stop:3078 length:1164 start_codon:yes stop_codon:yes gene_type:complete
MKFLIFYLFSFLVLTSKAQVPTDGLVSYYKFDNTLEDYGPNKFHGKGLSKLEYKEGTKCQGVVINDNLNDGISLNHNIIDGLNDFSISFYVQLFGLNNSNNIISCANKNQPNEFLIGYNSINKTQFNGWHIRINNTIYKFQFNNQIEDFKWHHVVIQRISNKAFLYIDNNQIGTGINTSNKTLNIANTGVIIGQDQDILAGGFDPKQNLNGALDEFRVYNRALSDNEITSIYNISACYNPIIREEIITNYVTITDTIKFMDTLTVHEVITRFDTITKHDTIAVIDTLKINLNLKDLVSQEVNGIKTIKVFPNPTSEFVTISIGENFELLSGVSISIVTLNGQTVFESYLNKKLVKVNTSTFTNKGVYVVNIINSNSIIIASKKLVIL